MTEQIQILLRRLECISRYLKVKKVFSMYLGRNGRWVPLIISILLVFKVIQVS